MLLILHRNLVKFKNVWLLKIKNVHLFDDGGVYSMLVGRNAGSYHKLVAGGDLLKKSSTLFDKGREKPTI